MTDMSSSGGIIDVPPAKKFKMPTVHRNFVENMLKGEASWLLFGLISFVCNYTVFRLLPGPPSWLLIAQIVLIALLLCLKSVWVLWAQINSIEVWTRDEAPIVDKHGNDDMGWTYWTYVLYAAMYVLAGFGLLVAFFIYVFHVNIPTAVPENLYVSWPILAYTPIMYLLTRIDLGPYATLYQRNNRLRTKLTRFEEQAH